MPLEEVAQKTRSKLPHFPVRLGSIMNLNTLFHSGEGLIFDHLVGPLDCAVDLVLKVPQLILCRALVNLDAEFVSPLVQVVTNGHAPVVEAPNTQGCMLLIEASLDPHGLLSLHRLVLARFTHHLVPCTGVLLSFLVEASLPSGHVVFNLGVKLLSYLVITLVR